MFPSWFMTHKEFQLFMCIFVEMIVQVLHSSELLVIVRPNNKSLISKLINKMAQGEPSNLSLYFQINYAHCRRFLSKSALLKMRGSLRHVPLIEHSSMAKRNRLLQNCTLITCFCYF